MLQKRKGLPMENICPICGKDNHCGSLTSKSHEECWCNTVVFPEEILFSSS